MPKKVRVLTRTLTYGDKLLGKNGEYTVSDAFAKENVFSGKVEIIEDLGEDATPLAENKVIDFEFMQKVKHHAPEIMAILESEFERQRAEKRATEQYEESLSNLDDKSKDSQLSTEESQPAAASAETTETDGKNEEISTSSEKGGPIDELGGTQATANGSIEHGTPIPQAFPGFTSLTKHGVTTMEQLEKLGYDDLIELGIRQGTANQIGAKLMELKNSDA